MEFFTDACAKYQKAVIKAHNQKRKRLHEQELEEDQRRQEAKERKDNDISEAEYKRHNTPGPSSGAKHDGCTTYDDDNYATVCMYIRTYVYTIIYYSITHNSLHCRSEGDRSEGA